MLHLSYTLHHKHCPEMDSVVQEHNILPQLSHECTKQVHFSTSSYRGGPVYQYTASQEGHLSPITSFGSIKRLQTVSYKSNKQEIYTIPIYLLYTNSSCFTLFDSLSSELKQKFSSI